MVATLSLCTPQVGRMYTHSDLYMPRTLQPLNRQSVLSNRWLEAELTAPVYNRRPAGIG